MKIISHEKMRCGHYSMNDIKNYLLTLKEKKIHNEMLNGAIKNDFIFDLKNDLMKTYKTLLKSIDPNKHDNLYKTIKTAIKNLKNEIKNN